MTNNVTQWTKAKLFGAIGKRTPVIARFSTVGGESGSSDAARDPRGFALKHYTEEGIYDVVGNNTPIFFIRDPQKFPDFMLVPSHEFLHLVLRLIVPAYSPLFIY